MARRLLLALALAAVLGLAHARSVPVSTSDPDARKKIVVSAAPARCGKCRRSGLENGLCVAIYQYTLENCRCLIPMHGFTFGRAS